MANTEAKAPPRFTAPPVGSLSLHPPPTPRPPTPPGNPPQGEGLTFPSRLTPVPVHPVGQWLRKLVNLFSKPSSPMGVWIHLGRSEVRDPISLPLFLDVPQIHSPLTGTLCDPLPPPPPPPL